MCHDDAAIGGGNKRRKPVNPKIRSPCPTLLTGFNAYLEPQQYAYLEPQQYAYLELQQYNKTSSRYICILGISSCGHG